MYHNLTDEHASNAIDDTSDVVGFGDNSSSGGQHQQQKIIHVYQIENTGPSEMLKADVKFLWPSFNLDGSPLLQITQQPSVTGSGICKNISIVTVRNAL